MPVIKHGFLRSEENVFPAIFEHPQGVWENVFPYNFQCLCMVGVTGGSRLSWIFWEHENLSGLSVIRLIQLSVLSFDIYTISVI